MKHWFTNGKKNNTTRQKKLQNLLNIERSETQLENLCYKKSIQKNRLYRKYNNIHELWITP